MESTLLQASEEGNVSPVKKTLESNKANINYQNL